MIVTRERHAFEGQSLTVISSIRRRGVLLVLAVLPDGSRSLIPAAWTNWIDDRAGIDPPPPDDPPAPNNLGSLADLLQVRAIVDGLLRRLAESAAQKETCHAVELGVPRPTETTTINRSDANPAPGPWEALEPQAQRQALDILARLIARTLAAAQKTEASHE